MAGAWKHTMWSHNRLHVTRNDMGRSLLGIGQNPENPARWSRKSSVLFGCPPLSTEGSLHQLRLGISTTHFMDIVVIDWHIVYIQEESGCGKNLWVEIFLGYKTSNLEDPRRLGTHRGISKSDWQCFFPRLSAQTPLGCTIPVAVVGQ